MKRTRAKKMPATIKAAWIGARALLITFIAGEILTISIKVIEWKQQEQVCNDNLRIAALPGCMEANQGYRRISAEWFTATQSADVLGKIAAEMRDWHMSHDLYLTSEGRRVYNVLIAAMRYAAETKVSQAERQERAQVAANLIWKFRDELLTAAWFASSSRDTSSLHVLGE